MMNEQTKRKQNSMLSKNQNAKIILEKENENEKRNGQKALNRS